MEVMKGYDKKGIGIIPQDWDIVPVSELVRKGDGIKIGPFGSQLKKELLVKRGLKVYGQENVFHKNLEIGNRYLTKNHFIKLQSCELLEGDFIVSMMGTIGKTMVMPKSFEKGIMDSHLLRLRLRGDLIDTKFFLLTADNIVNIGLQLFFGFFYVLSLSASVLLLTLRYVVVAIGIIFVPIGIFLYTLIVEEFGMSCEVFCN